MENVLEEHGPNRALVGCDLDSFLGPPSLVLAYCVVRVRRKKFQLECNAQDARMRGRQELTNYAITSTHICSMRHISKLKSLLFLSRSFPTTKHGVKDKMTY